MVRSSTPPPPAAWIYVSEIKEYRPVANKIRPEDQTLAMDNGHVGRRSAVGASKLLARKSRQAGRKIALRNGSNTEAINAAGDLVALALAVKFLALVVALVVVVLVLVLLVLALPPVVVVLALFLALALMVQVVWCRLWR